MTGYGRVPMAAARPGSSIPSARPQGAAPEKRGSVTPITPADGTHLETSDADVARRAVFTWMLLPTASRLVREAKAGRDVSEPIADLRAAVRLLDRLGWPEESKREVHLSAEEAHMVRRAARTHAHGGLDPEATAVHGRGSHRLSRPPHGSVGNLLVRLGMEEPRAAETRPRTTLMHVMTGPASPPASP